MPERNYTHSEMRTMQDEAIQRVMEMQRIANERLQRSNAAAAAESGQHGGQPEPAHRENHSSGQQNRNQSPPPSQPRNRQQEGAHSQRQESRGHPSPSHHAMPVDLPEPQTQPQELHQQSSSPLSFLTSGAFEGIVKRLGLETDQLILIGLLLLLINEGADTILIMAVFYLLI